jgi:hypothetical protein
VARKLFLLLEFLLDLAHFLSDAVVGAHCKTLAHELGTKNKEQYSSGHVCEAFWEESWYSMTHDRRENGHDDQGGESGREDEEAGVPHSHESSHQERLVSNLREDDHCEGQDKRVEWLDDAAGLIV